VKYVESRTTFEVDHLQTPARILLLVVVPERNQLSIRRNCGSDRQAVGDFFQSAAIDRNSPYSVRTIRTGMLKHDPFAVGRNRGPRALCHFKRQLLRPAAVAIRSPDLKHTRAVRMKYDVAIVRRNYGRIIS